MFFVSGQGIGPEPQHSSQRVNVVTPLERPCDCAVRNSPPWIRQGHEDGLLTWSRVSLGRNSGVRKSNSWTWGCRKGENWFRQLNPVGDYRFLVLSGWPWANLRLPLSQLSMCSGGPGFLERLAPPGAPQTRQPSRQRHDQDTCQDRHRTW